MEPTYTSKNVDIVHLQMTPMENDRNKIVLTKWLGRFGNRIYTYVFASHLNSRFGFAIYAPSRWEGSILFEHAAKWKIITNDAFREKLTQSKVGRFLEARSSAVAEYNRDTGDDLTLANVEEYSQYGIPNLAFESLCCGRPWIFAQYTKTELRRFLEFSDEVKSSPVYKHYQGLQGTYDVAHVRRGDILYRLDDKYSVISLKSYQRAMDNCGCDPKQVICVSDDVRLRTRGFDFCDSPLSGDWKYPEGQLPVPNVFYSFFQDFLKMIFARRLFRANSSFSWWAGFLATGEVYSPVLRERVKYCKELREIDCEFVPGNEPHWLLLPGEGCDRIIIPD